MQKLQDSLKAEAQKSSSLREQLNAQLAGGSEATIRKLTEELERLRADTMALKKVREELVDANRKAIESQASLTKERREREALAARVAELESRPAPPPAPAAEVERRRGGEAPRRRREAEGQAGRGGERRRERGAPQVEGRPARGPAQEEGLTDRSLLARSGAMTAPPLHIGIVACSAEGAALCYRTLCTEAPRAARAVRAPRGVAARSLLRPATTRASPGTTGQGWPS